MAAEAIDEDQAVEVCANWLMRIADSPGAWAETRTPVIVSSEALSRNGRLLGHYFTIEPAGYVLIAADRALPPVIACSETAAARSASENPFLEFVLPQLESRMALIRETAFAADRAWPRYLKSPVEFERAAKAAFDEVGPLLSTRWGQEFPFNLYCPTIGGYTTKLGCVATATAQLIAYHQWPLSGVGDHAYTWNGDQSCGGDTPEKVVYADFSDPYDWPNMPDSAVDMTPVDQQALAEICYETAVAVEMDFGLCSSSTSLARSRAALVNYFRYKSSASEQMRFRFPTSTWFSMIEQNISAGHPVIYYTVVHVLVCDGTRDVDGLQQIHLNYGWKGASDDWYALDSIYTSANPFSERMIMNIEPDTDQPINLDAFFVQGGPMGVVINWELSPTADHVSFQLYRNAMREKALEPISTTVEQFGTSYEVVEAYLPPGHYEYWLEGWQKTGNRQWFGPAELDLVIAVPDLGTVRGPYLAAPYPNPFNPSTTIAFEVPGGGWSRLAVYDLGGRLIRVLVDGVVGDGARAVHWDGRGDDGRAVGSGVFFMRLETDGCVRMRRGVLVR